MQQPKNKLNLNHVRSTRELVLICTILKSTLVQEVYVHSFNQDERAQVSAGQRDRQDIINYGRNEIFRFLTYPVKKKSIEYESTDDYSLYRKTSCHCNNENTEMSS